jgi:glycosyltransferase involved in cell wall biosynthesis
MGGRKSVLISTLPIDYGFGVASHAAFVIDFLRERDFEVTLAYYRPYSMEPNLSVPAWKLGRRHIGVRTRILDSDVAAHEIGCWLPELEFTNYWLTREWKSLIANHDMLLAVTGNPLAALPFAACGRPYLAWLGTPFSSDREVRVREFPIVRKIVDRALNTPACLYCERRVLNSGLILPTTSFVAREFRRVAPRAQILDPVPVPVETDYFTPGTGIVEDFSIAFTGRFNDPRKNIFLLLEALRICRDRGVPATLNLYGDTPSPAVLQRIRRLKLEESVRGLRRASREELRAIYRRSSVFVIPSFQEGLCVAGLEAAACGCPVVTSPCGGPEDYVMDGSNGLIVPLDAAAFAAAICRILCSSEERRRLSSSAIRTVLRSFSREIVGRDFLAACDLLHSTNGVSRGAAHAAAN